MGRTFVDFSIKTVDALKDWILKELGYPLVTIELTDDQLDLAINDALEFYTEYAEMQSNYLLLDLNNYVEDVGISVSGYNVKTVFSLDEEMSSGINTLFSIENQMLNQGVFPYRFGAQGALVTYELANQWMELAKRVLCQKFDFEFSVRSQTLKLWPDPIKLNKKGYVILGVKTVPAVEDLVGEHYVKRLALAKAKLILGTIRKKFDGVQLPGGGTIDASIGDEGKEEWDKWTDEVVKWIGPHNYWFIG